MVSLVWVIVCINVCGLFFLVMDDIVVVLLLVRVCEKLDIRLVKVLLFLGLGVVVGWFVKYFWLVGIVVMVMGLFF